jgi:hypothetical protein
LPGNTIEEVYEYADQHRSELSKIHGSDQVNSALDRIADKSPRVVAYSDVAKKAAEQMGRTASGSPKYSMMGADYTYTGSLLYAAAPAVPWFPSTPFSPTLPFDSTIPFPGIQVGSGYYPKVKIYNPSAEISKGVGLEVLLPLTIGVTIGVIYARNNQKALERDMNDAQKEVFQREIEDYKRMEGRGGKDNLPWEILKDIAEDILKYYQNK